MAKGVPVRRVIWPVGHPAAFINDFTLYPSCSEASSQFLGNTQSLRAILLPSIDLSPGDYNPTFPEIVDSRALQKLS